MAGGSDKSIVNVKLESVEDEGFATVESRGGGRGSGRVTNQPESEGSCSEKPEEPSNVGNESTEFSADKDEQTIYSEVKIKPESVVDAAGATAGGGTKLAALVPNLSTVSVLIVSLCVLMGSAAGIIYLSILATNQRSEIQSLSSESGRLKGQRAELQNLTLDLQNLTLNLQNRTLNLQNLNLDLYQQRDQLNGALRVMQSFFCRDKPCPPCDDGWLRFQNSCYLFDESDNGFWRTWEQSKYYCSIKTRRVSDLVIVDSQEEQRFIHEQIKYYLDDYHGYWIGLSKRVNGSWVWEDGRVDTLGFWKEKEYEMPGPNVMVMPNHKVTASWHSGDDVFLNKFICESKALID